MNLLEATITIPITTNITVSPPVMYPQEYPFSVDLGFLLLLLFTGRETGGLIGLLSEGR